MYFARSVQMKSGSWERLQCTQVAGYAIVRLEHFCDLIYMFEGILLCFRCMNFTKFTKL